jgi:release factor glutamine methyltransferase
MLVELAYKQLQQKLESLYEKREATIIANWVIEQITGLKRMDRILLRGAILNEGQIEELTSKTNQLLNSEPIQYVLGNAWFSGLNFYVNPSVLIPRPETEELVEWINDDNDLKKFKQILDIGTGSGCIPITLKLKNPFSNVMSLDISNEALIVAQKNAEKLNALIQLKQLNFLDESKWQDLPNFDCIVSNPPYIKDSERISMSKNVTDFEPTIALFVTDKDPLIFYRKIAHFGKLHLEKNGAIYLEINQALGQDVLILFEQNGYSVELRKDLMGNDRMAKAIFLI